jgi:ABC-type Mn2+/Zn2+ transport system ATPase subunit
MLSIARGLMTDPELVVFDEPSLGLSPLFVSEVFAIVRRLKTAGITILLLNGRYAALACLFLPQWVITNILHFLKAFDQYHAIAVLKCWYRNFCTKLCRVLCRHSCAVRAISSVAVTKIRRAYHVGQD